MAVRHRVVIVGGGYGGLYAAKALGGKDMDVTLVDRRNHHVFSPLLYQVATGALAPSDIAQPLRRILRRHSNVRVLLGEARELDPEARTVTLDDGSVLSYDSLIVATGTSIRKLLFYFAPSIRLPGKVRECPLNSAITVPVSSRTVMS